MVSSTTALQDLLSLAPDWQAVAESVKNNSSAGTITAFDLFQRLGAKSIYAKAGANTGSKHLMALIRDHYFQPLMAKMFNSNQNLKRFWIQRHVPMDVQKHQAVSLSVELAQKLEGVLNRHLMQKSEDGFKVLLPAYVQRTVHNAVVDYIRDEWQWEHATLQDMNLDPEMDDPRQNTSDELQYTPENRALSREQVEQLNMLRHHLESLLSKNPAVRDALEVVDCMFGLGLTEHSTTGSEMTMRECCDKLKLSGDTPARKIARCQVLLDKGLDMIRQSVRTDLPSVAECWQSEINVNSASRRELGHQLGFTETEVDRLIVSRQYMALKQLVERSIIKPPRLPEVEKRGAVAAFVLIDLNSATNRDLIDITGAHKELSQKIITNRPYRHLTDVVDKKIVDKAGLNLLIERGAVVKHSGPEGERADLNQVQADDLKSLGVPEVTIQRLVRGRPFTTWSELEDYLCCEPGTWLILRQKFCLGLGFS